MEPIEQYRIMVERNSKDISMCWKLASVFCYLLCAVFGYAGAILTFVFRYNICDGNCLLWASAKLGDQSSHEQDDYTTDYNEKNSLNNNTTLLNVDWTKNIITTFEHPIHCNVFEALHICSCIFGVTWLIYFSMCGKGGNSMKMYEKPWRIVFPALFFDSIFLLAAIITVYRTEIGYSTFSSELHMLSNQINGSYNKTLSNRECDSMQDLFAPFNVHKFSMCTIITSIRVSSGIIILGWFGGLATLLLRVICIVDFRLTTVRVYSVPAGSTANEIITRLQ